MGDFSVLETVVTDLEQGQLLVTRSGDTFAKEDMSTTLYLGLET